MGTDILEGLCLVAPDPSRGRLSHMSFWAKPISLDSVQLRRFEAIRLVQVHSIRCNHRTALVEPSHREEPWLAGLSR